MRFPGDRHLPLAVPPAGDVGCRETLNITAFGAKADGSDTTPSVRAALEQVRHGKADKLTFRRAVMISGRIGREQYLFISNNDEGFKRIAFPLVGEGSGD